MPLISRSAPCSGISSQDRTAPRRGRTRTPARHFEGLIWADHGFKLLTHRTVASRASHVALLNYHFGNKEP